MTGETNLTQLLLSMSPILVDDEYVFCSIQAHENGTWSNQKDYSELSPIATFQESEGLTLVVTRDNADKASLPYDSTFRCITLAVHSSLEAVGLTAAVATKLADKGISANVIAAYYHDHIFIQAAKADLAMVALAEFSR